MSILQQQIFVILYLIVMIFYLKVETGKNNQLRTIVKVTLSGLFLVNSIINVFSHNMSIPLLHLLAGIAFSFIGDYLLTKSMIIGGIAFLVANILYMVYMNNAHYALQVEMLSLPLLTIAILLLIYYYMIKSGYLQLGKKKVFSLYMIFVTISGSFALIMALKTQHTSLFLLGIGLALAMISDYFLASHFFHDKDNKPILRINSSSYFIGMMLVSLSTFFVG